MSEHSRDAAATSADDPRLAVALRALPLEAAPGDTWQQIQATLAARQRRQRMARRIPWLAAAAAAVFALAIGLRPAAVTPGHVPQAVAVAPATAPDPVAATRELIEGNQVLEAMLRASDPAGMALDGEAALASAQLEDLIGMLDLELSAAREPQQVENLWRQRLALLQQLAGTRQLGLAAVADADRAAFSTTAYIVN